MLEVRKIVLRDGSVLEIEMSQTFVEHVRKQFMLNETQSVEDEHIRMYFYGAVDNALKKVEDV